MICFDRKPRLAPLLAGLVIWLVSTLAAADHLKMRDDGVAILGYARSLTSRRPPDAREARVRVCLGRVALVVRDRRAPGPVRPRSRALRSPIGGYCTGGLSLGYKMVADPENWQIVDGQLYLHHSKKSLDKTVADPGP